MTALNSRFYIKPKRHTKINQIFQYYNINEDRSWSEINAASITEMHAITCSSVNSEVLVSFGIDSTPGIATIDIPVKEPVNSKVPVLFWY